MSMYVPQAFSPHDLKIAQEVVEEYPFALLVTGAQPYPRITHAPMFATGWDGELCVYGHLARANRQASDIAGVAEATAVFEGPHAYVSASWYEAPANNVPTWNYIAVHLSGRLREHDAREIVAMLERKFEDGRPSPWRMNETDPAYIARQLSGIVGFSLRVERFECSMKLSQNRSKSDRERVIAQLEASPSQIERACGQAMKRLL